MWDRGYRQLIVSILLQVKNDLEIIPKRKGKYYLSRSDILAQQDALRFMETQWFEELCLAVDLEPLSVKEAFLNKPAIGHISEL